MIVRLIRGIDCWKNAFTLAISAYNEILSLHI